MYLPNSSKKSVFKGSLTGFNSEFSLLTGCNTKLKGYFSPSTNP